MSNAWEADWRKRTKARGVDPDKVLARMGKGPAAAPMPSAGGERPRAGDPAVRPDRASREGVLSKQASLMTTLARIARSELKDQDKQKLYETAGASESMVAAALRAINEDGEVQDVGAIQEANQLPARRSDSIASFSNPSPEFVAAAKRLRQIEDRRERKAAGKQAETAVELEGQFQEMTRDDPWWMDTLMFVDRYTRSPVVAAFSQLGAVLDDALGFDPDGTKSVASWDRFMDQWQNNTFASELIDEDMMPGWARFIVGTTADVLLDPLTYLTGGSAAVAKVTGKGGAKLANELKKASSIAAKNAKKLEDATDAAAVMARETSLNNAAAYNDLALRVGPQGGFGGLSKTDRALAEQALKGTGFLEGKQTLRGGIYFRLPGTEGIRIPVLSEVLQPLGTGAARGSGALRRSERYARITSPFSTPKRDFLRKFASLDSKLANEALVSLRAFTDGDIAGMSYRELMMADRGVIMLATNRWKEATKLTDQDLVNHLRAQDSFTREGVPNPVMQLIESEGTDGTTASLVEGWKRWWTQAAERANGKLGDTTDLLGRPNFITERPDYVFNARLQAGSDLLDAAKLSGAKGADASAPEKFASVAVGRNFRGEEILDPLVHPQRLSPEDQAVDILNRQARASGVPGVEDEIVKLFSGDLNQLTSSYVNIVSSRISFLKMAQEMMLEGVAVSGKIIDDAARLSKGKSLWRSRERHLQRHRFPVDVAGFRAATQAAVDAGAAPVKTAVGEALDAVDNIVALRATMSPDWDAVGRGLAASTARVGGQLDEVLTLSARAKTLLDELAEDAERLYRTGNADELFDITMASVSASTLRKAGELADVERRLAQFAAEFNPKVMEKMLRSNAQLALDQTDIVRQLEGFKGLNVGLGKPNDVGVRSATRNTLEGIADKEQVVREIARAEQELVHAGEVAGLTRKVHEMFDALEDFATSQDGSYDQIMRALTPGKSDGVVKLSDGRTAVFTRTGLVKGQGVLDRLGPRFQLSDDVAASLDEVLAQLPGGKKVSLVRRLKPDVEGAPTVSGERALQRNWETDGEAARLWNLSDDAFEQQYARLVEDAEMSFLAERSLAEVVDPSPELLAQTTRRALDNTAQTLDRLIGEGMNFGGTWTARQGDRFDVGWYFRLDVSKKGYRRFNPKTGKWGKGQVRGGEFDWWDSLDGYTKRRIQSKYLTDRGKRGGKGSKSKPDGFAQENKLPMDGGALGKGTANISASMDDWGEAFLGWIGRWEETQDVYTSIKWWSRPRAGDRGNLIELLKSIDAFETKYLQDQLSKMRYTPEQFRAILDEVDVLSRNSMSPPANSELFGFRAVAKKSKVFVGDDPQTMLLGDMLHNAVRAKQLVLKPTTTLDSVDALMWNETVGSINNFALIKEPTNTQLERFVSRLGPMVRGFAEADPDSLAARVVASSQNPGQAVLDSIVNFGALGRTERELLGDWNSLLASTEVSAGGVAAGYRNRLKASGFDGLMLDDYKTRELIAFQRNNMMPENAASRLLLQLEEAQAGVKDTLSKLRTEEQSLSKQWGLNPSWHTFDADAAEAAQVANSKAIRRLNAKLRRQQISEEDIDEVYAAQSTILDELMFRDDARESFQYAAGLYRQADKLQKQLDDTYRSGVRQAQRADGTPGPRNDNPVAVKTIAELRYEADNWRLVAQADVGEADAVAAGMSRSYDDLFAGNLAQQPDLAENLTLMLADGMKRLNNGAYAPEWVVDVVNKGALFGSPESTKKFLRVIDYLTGVFKSYAVMTPGFINRNFVGGVMNNWLGLVNVKSYVEFYMADKAFRNAIRQGKSLDDAFAAVGKRMNKQAEAAYRDWYEIAPAVSGGMAASFAGDVGVSGAAAIEKSGYRSAFIGTDRGIQAFGKTVDLPVANSLQSLRDNSATRTFFYLNTRSEYRLRGPMAWDELMRKGGDQVSATQRVFQFHFDYSAGGMSNFERNKLKRFIPFYVWMANNVPLQIKGLVTRPKVAASYIKVKQNMEELSEDDAIVPSYFGRLGGIRLPFKDADGNHMYFMPDLPVRDLGMFSLDKAKFSLNPVEMGSSIIEMNELMSSVNPWFKVPAETLLLDRKVFTDAPFRDGYVPISKAVQRIPGLTAGLKLLGQYKVDADGRPMSDEKVLYALESAQPWLARLNRLFPADGDDALQARRMSTVLSIFLGVGFRTNTFRDQSNELFKRQDELDLELRKLRSLGVDVPTASELKRSDKEQAAIASWNQMPAEANYVLQTINSGNVDAIKDLNGFGDVSAAEMAANVQTYGGFADLEDLGTAKGVPQSAVTKALEALGERRSASLDFATADIDDLIAMPGIGPKTAPKIQAYARRNGGIGNLGELRQFGLSNKQIQALDIWLREEREFQRMLAGVR